ncbi:hypothetical protein GLAREA_02094 [Glarea lozoyensis ATCC 20868]|uniref:Uncharacterized protein n=1 Tax=Glarea lozoyensis (strain ATCC 20868 / MF5171) TaxID=1116229 RepID=S3CI69_GLAL2|nr:uncharacterized protein GLAREA_02094 [Glarea lozoyensis ATCC 20868]EPE26182.1 hypothetical protein GLAREA_02094 [Glarea lozoyensis ATCC 20868]
MPLGNPGYHSNADTTIVDLVAAVLISGDPYGQSDMRRLNGHNSPLGDRYMDDAVRLDDIRRINLIAQIANNAVTPRMQYAEVHPKLSTIDGRYPREFDTPHRIESFLAADNQTLDRILAAYNLPLNPSLSNSNANGLGTSLLAPRSLNSDRVRDAKLITLLQYLGVDVEGSGSGNGRLGGGSGLGGGGLGGGTQGLLAQLGRALGNGGGGNGGRGLGGLGSGSGGGGLGNTG